MKSRFKVLHISSYYSRNSLFKSLTEQLGYFGYHQSVYVPVRLASDIGRNEIKGDSRVEFCYDLILRKQHKVLYHNKVRSITESIISKEKHQGVSLIHAHSLFSDGGVALELKRKFGIPYVVAVRSTDINAFFKKALHLRNQGKRILNEASKVVFINQGHMETVFAKYLSGPLKGEIKSKSSVIPNGLHPFWLAKEETRSYELNSTVRFLYVGTFLPRKNVPLAIRVVRHFAKVNENLNVEFTIVGGGGRGGHGEGDKEVAKQLSLKNPDNLTIIAPGRISDKEELVKIYQNSDLFMMLSKGETFGVVYLEAMSQGVPIISTMGEGISSYFDDYEVGVSVNIEDEKKCVEEIQKVVESYDTIAPNCRPSAQKFSWPSIASKYDDIYKDIITNK